MFCLQFAKLVQIFDFVNECVKFRDVFDGWGCFETGIEVDSCKLWMMELQNPLCVVFANAACEKERDAAMIVVEDVPIELLSATSVGVPLCWNL